MLGFAHRKRVKRIMSAAIATAFVAVQLPLFLLVPVASAENKKPDKVKEDKKITICHRTNSVKNPYQQIEVSYDATTGALKDQGRGDHTTHTGEEFDPDTDYPTPRNGDQWGDIIPPYTFENGSYAGMNWDVDGQAIYNNDCEAGDPIVTATGVTQVDLCGLQKDAIMVPNDANVEYRIGDTVLSVGSNPIISGGTVSVTAYATEDYTLANAYSQTFTFTDTACSTNVTAQNVTFNDQCELENDTYTIPMSDSDEVLYQINGQTIAAGTYAGTGTVTINAVAASSQYTVQGTTQWSVTFTNEACEEEDKVEICHATSSASNPYNKIGVSISSVDGDTGNNNGQGDHYAEHTGPIFDPASNQSGDDWGDIIPPVAGHDGRNWNAQGQAIYNNGDCEIPENEEEDTGTITVVKTTNPSNNRMFSFNFNGTTNFSLAGNGGSRAFNELALDKTYTVSENVAAGWGLQDITCGEAEVTVSLVNRTVSIDLNDDQRNVTCTFANVVGGQGGGDTDEDDGDVLGIITVKPTVPAVKTAATFTVTPGQGGGEVFGETLVDTGSSALYSIIVGLMLIGSAGALTIASRREQQLPV